MRVLVASTYFDTHLGGVEIVAGRLARELADAGHVVELAATDSSEAPKESKITVHPLPSSNFIEDRVGLPLPILMPRGIVELYARCGASDAVLIHDTLGAVCFFAFISAKLQGKPVLILQHLGDARFSRLLVRAIFRIGERVFTRPMLSLADQVAYIGETTARHFSKVRLKRPARISFSGVDTSIFRPRKDDAEKNTLRQKFGLSETKTVVLYVGRFVETKGLAILRATAQLRPDLDFALAGWGPIDPARWGLPNVQSFSGLTGDSLSQLYRGADIFLLASHSESFSLVVREALASGLPVICGTDVAATDVELAAYVTTVPIDSTNAKQTAVEISTRIDTAMTSGSAATGIAFVRTRYDWKQIAALISGLLEALVPSKENRDRVCPPVSAAD